MSSNGTASTLPPSSLASSSRRVSSPPLPSVTPSSAPAPAPSSAPAPSNPPSSAEPPSSAPPASPTPVLSSAPPPASSAPPPASSAPPAQSSAPPASSRPPPVSTQVVTASSARPSITEVRTSIVVVTPTPSVAGETPNVVTVTLVSTPSANAQKPNSATSNAASASSTDPALQGARKESSGGLSTGGKTAIAVVIPVVVVALLVLGAILFWRKRKQRKSNEDERRKEVEEYGFNPNHDPTLPAVGMQTEMAEDSSGYRGWGNTTTSSNRKASTTLTSGMTYSDSNSNPGGYASPGSPTHGAYSDVNSNDPLVNGRRETLDSDGIAALGAAPTANNQTGVHRGPSNASSSYSVANHSDNSGEYPGMHMNHPPEYYEQGYGSYQDGPYGGNNAYGAGQQPVIRDVSARRNTRIENPSVFPQQGNSGVATNF